MKPIRLTIVASLCVLGCAHQTPKELENARVAYDRARQNPAAGLAPAELEEARLSLDRAEAEYAAHPKSQRAADLAYVADRKAEYAESVAATELDRKARQKLVSAFTRMQARRLAAVEAALQGAGKVTVEPRGTVITLTSAVLFPFDDATLRPESEKQLKQLADGLLETKESNLIIEGHTDTIGPHEYNVELSEKRAAAVKEYLVKQGYDADRISTKGMGEERPLAPNDSAENRATNRRVEIIIGTPKDKD
jgi:outer membrane protein OmpA-like peptidoglycan-associated protein